MTGQPSDPTPIDAAPPPLVSRKMMIRLVLALAVFLVIGGLLGWSLRDQIEWAGAGFMNRFGLPGLGLLTVFIDSSPIPLTHEPLMILALGADASTWAVLSIFVWMSTGSIAAGGVGWFCGRLVGVGTPIGRWLMHRSPRGLDFVQRWGVTGVAIAALTPIPYGLTTWAAGMAGVPLPGVLLGSLARIPRIAFYLGIIWLGWSSPDLLGMD